NAIRRTACNRRRLQAPARRLQPLLDELFPPALGRRGAVPFYLLVPVQVRLAGRPPGLPAGAGLQGEAGRSGEQLTGHASAGLTSATSPAEGFSPFPVEARHRKVVLMSIPLVEAV